VRNTGAGRGLPDLLALPIKNLPVRSRRRGRAHCGGPLGGWQQLLDGFLKARVGGGRFTPLRLSEDYAAYVDGKPRYEGVRSFLQSRAIDLPSDNPHDRPDAQTICGLGHRKDGLFAKVTHRHVVECSSARSR
jgi:hypothetical protein